jgi:tRNA(Leu) C34 or U34 (ribose-2'-O)-methylase TrmL
VSPEAETRNAAVLLVDPKYPHNVGNAVRACAVFGVPQLRWTGRRVDEQLEYRLPREERLREYRERVTFQRVGTHLAKRPVDHFVRWGLTPVCCEVADEAESLVDFVHPGRAVYVFGPEDGHVPKGVRHACHRFVTIPSDGCLNLASAVNVVLYDRMAKRPRSVSEMHPAEDLPASTRPGRLAYVPEDFA